MSGFVLVVLAFSIVMSPGTASAQEYKGNGFTLVIPERYEADEGLISLYSSDVLGLSVGMPGNEAISKLRKMGFYTHHRAHGAAPPDPECSSLRASRSFYYLDDVPELPEDVALLVTLHFGYSSKNNCQEGVIKISKISAYKKSYYRNPINAKN